MKFRFKNQMYNDVFALAIPIFAEQSFMIIMGIINAIMAGRIGKEAVSAIGMVDSVNNIVFSFFAAVAIGGTVIVAHHTGREDTSGANAAVNQAILSCMAISLAVSVLIFALRGPIINILYGSAERAVLDYAYQYLNITLLTYPLIAVTSMSFAVLRGAGDTRTPMKISIAMNVVNVLMSYVFIFGIRTIGADTAADTAGWLVRPMGVRGAAIGISIARILGAAAIIYTLARGSKSIRLTLNLNTRPDFKILKSIFGVGFPASVESLLFTTGKLITQVFVVGMGTAAIAANFIGNSIFNFINVPGNTMCIVAIAMVGQYFGCGRKEDARKLLMFQVKVTSVCMLVICLFLFPSARFVASLYSKSIDVIEMAAVVLKSSIIMMPTFWGLSFVLPAGLKGAGDGKFTMVTSIAGMWIFRISAGYILGVTLGLGIMGVWMGMYIDWIVRGTAYYFRVRSSRWLKDRIAR